LVQDDLVQTAKVAAKTVAFGISRGAWIVWTSTEKNREGKLTVGRFDDIVLEHVRYSSLKFSFKMEGNAVWPAVNRRGPRLELNLSFELWRTIELKTMRQIVDENVGEFLMKGLSKVRWNVC